MSPEKNMIMAIVLSMTVLLGWHYFIEKPKIEEHQKRVEAERKAKADLPQAERPLLESEARAKPVNRQEALLKQPARVKINSPVVAGSISLKGLRFDDLVLEEYNKELDPASGYVELLSPTGTRHIYFAEFGWVAADKSINIPNSNTIWTADRKELTPSSPVTFTWDNGQGLIFKETVALDKDHMFNITQSVENRSGETVQVAFYGLINRNKEEYTDFLISHEGVLGVFDGILFDELTYNDMLEDMQQKEKREFEDVSGWFGMGDKYWLTAIVPGAEKFDTSFSYNTINSEPRYQAEYIGHLEAIEPGQQSQSTQLFYAGAKKVGLLDRYENELNIPLFDHAVDFGVMYFLTKPIFLSLKFFNGFLGNFGLAIMLLTVCIKLVLFPLANKGYRSMNKLKQLQPQMVELRERHKNDKVKMQQEIMALYKREKVNPASGCLPILIQLPIFFSLYKVLFITIEMRHAPFYGWIKDLSAPDPTSMFNLFGLLPFTPPSFLMIGVWPCIMAITMIIQQKLNPPPPDPVQANMIKALPFIFVFLFAQFPAGLIIYWAWSNTLAIIQQKVIARVPASERKIKA